MPTDVPPAAAGHVFPGRAQCAKGELTDRIPICLRGDRASKGDANNPEACGAAPSYRGHMHVPFANRICSRRTHPTNS